MSKEVKQTQQFILRAMAKNYAGGHNWDHLDSEACTKAADEIAALEAECERLRGQVQTMSDALDRWPSIRDGLKLKLSAAEQRNISLSAELAAIRAAGGEQVEVVAHLIIPTKGSYKGRHFTGTGLPPEHPSALKEYVPLMTVAQHQRLMHERWVKVCSTLKERNDAREELEKHRRLMAEQMERERGVAQSITVMAGKLNMIIRGLHMQIMLLTPPGDQLRKGAEVAIEAADEALAALEVKDGQ